MATPNKNKKGVAVASAAAATIIASLPLSASPHQTVELRQQTLQSLTVVKDFVNSLHGAHLLPRTDVGSLLSVSDLSKLLAAGCTVYVCIADVNKTYCCRVQILDQQLVCSAMKHNDMLPKGAVWLMTP